MLITRHDVAEVKRDLESQCRHGGSTVVSQAAGTVSCRHVLSGEQGFWAQALIGNGYASTPVAIVHFSLKQRGPGTRVDWNADIEARLPSGQVRRLPLNDSHFNEEIRDSLAGLD